MLTKCKGCGQLGHKTSRCLQKSSLEAKNTLLDAQVKDQRVTIATEDIIMDVTMTPTTSTNEGIPPTKDAPPMQTAIQSGTPIACNTIVSSSEKSAAIDDKSEAPPTATPSTKKDDQPNEVVPHSPPSSYKDNQVDPKKSLDAPTETITEILNELTVGKDPDYSSSEDTFDENQQMEETLQRKSTRGTKPTLKAREMQRSANKGRRGKGRRGRGHR